MLAALIGRVFSKNRPTYADGNFATVLNPRGDLSCVEGLPIKTECVRQGGTYMCAIATGSAFTYVAAWPTTRAELVLFNGEPAGGNSYVIDSAFVVDITSAGAAQSKTLLAQLVAPGAIATIPTQDTAQLVTSRSGRNGYGGTAKRAVANTAMGQAANRWEVVGVAPGNPNTASIGTAVYTDLYGGWIVPPAGGLALAGLASTGAGTAIIGVTWHEVVLPVIG